MVALHGQVEVHHGEQGTVVGASSGLGGRAGRSGQQKDFIKLWLGRWQ